MEKFLGGSTSLAGASGLLLLLLLDGLRRKEGAGGGRGVGGAQPAARRLTWARQGPAASPLLGSLGQPLGASPARGMNGRHSLSSMETLCQMRAFPPGGGGWLEGNSCAQDSGLHGEEEGGGASASALCCCCCCWLWGAVRLETHPGQGPLSFPPPTVAAGCPLPSPFPGASNPPPLLHSSWTEQGQDTPPPLCKATATHSLWGDLSASGCAN